MDIDDDVVIPKKYTTGVIDSIEGDVFVVNDDSYGSLERIEGKDLRLLPWKTAKSSDQFIYRVKSYVANYMIQNVRVYKLQAHKKTENGFGPRILNIVLYNGEERSIREAFKIMGKKSSNKTKG